MPLIHTQTHRPVCFPQLCLTRLRVSCDWFLAWDGIWSMALPPLVTGTNCYVGIIFDSHFTLYVSPCSLNNA